MNENKIKLSEWAKQNNLSYKQSWQLIQNKEFPEKIERNKKGSIFVLKETKASENKKTEFLLPALIGDEKKISIASNTRRNRASTIENPSDEYAQIEKGTNPFVLGSNADISVNRVINLCQLAYWNFSIFRNTIDVMSEFSCSKIFLRGGSAKSRDFFYALFNKINITDLQDKIFREYYRSGNVFIYRFDSSVQPEDIVKLNQTFGIESQASKKIKLPAKYIILNPAEIQVEANVIFSSCIFFKRLTSYEILRLKKPQTDAEKDLFNAMPKPIQERIINTPNNTSIIIPLDPEYICPLFYKKQDYEPLAIPMGYPVLKDIAWKAEMKAVDMAVARTMQQIVLLVNIGYENKQGEYMYDQKVADMMTSLFTSQSVGKTLVADFTTKVSWAIPTIGDFLDPKKYQIVNEDIQIGLNNILTGRGEKFANQTIQAKLFIQRLQEGREIFLNNFLIPEIKRIAKAINLKNYPIPFFDDITMKDEEQFARIVTRLTEIGVLSPSETFTAIESGRLPTKEESMEAQEEYIKLRDKGYYLPLVGTNTQGQLQVLDETGKQQSKMQDGQLSHNEKITKLQHKHEAENPQKVPNTINIQTQPAQNIKKPNGRPHGSGKPKERNTISPIGASEKYSLSKIKDNLIIAAQLRDEIKSSLLKKHNLKELNEKQQQVMNDISDIIMTNEKSEDWLSKAKEYINNPINKNENRLKEVDEIAFEHQIDMALASVLIDSKT